jgi:hypothetical protein
MLKSVFVTICFIFILFVSCSDTCEGENPTVQLFNSGTGKADIQIKTSGGNTENINNIEPENYSEKRSFDPGEIEFTIAIQGVDEPIVYFLIVDYCTDNLVTINDDNTITATSIRLDYF